MDYATISQLSPDDQLRLFPFYSAEREFDLNVMTGHQFRREGYDKVTPESCGMEEAESTLDRIDVLSAFVFTVEGDLLPREDAAGDTWRQNRLKAWRQPRTAYRPAIPTQF